MSDDLVSEIRAIHFSTTRLREGYEIADVDRFLDQLVAAASAGQPLAPLCDAARFDPVRLREGYDMAEVDAFLAKVAGAAVERRTREFQVTIDCADPAGLSAFWAEVLGYVLDAPPPGFATWPEALDAWGVPEDQRNSRSAIHDPAGAGPRLFFQQVPEGKTVKNRLHLDVRCAPGVEDADERMRLFEAECARLVALGATRLRRVEPTAMDAGIIVMQDPEGNEFCID